MCHSTSRLLIVAVSLILISCPSLLAQRMGPPISRQITGQVRFAQGSAPASNILINCETFRGGLVGQEQTDRNGKFRFIGLKPDQYVVTIRLPGFRYEQQAVGLQNVAIGHLQFQLRAEGSSTAATVNAVVNAKVSPAAQREFEKGRHALLDGGKPEEGIPHLVQALKISPNYFEAELLLGTAYMDTQQWDKAEHALRRALAIDPKKVEAYVALGELYRHRKKHSEAEKVLLEGLKVESNSWRGHFTLGRVYWDAGKIYKAAPHVGRALQLKPDLAEGHLLGGDILLRARQPVNALIEFEEYLRLDPQGRFAPQTRNIVAKLKKALAEKKIK